MKKMYRKPEVVETLEYVDGLTASELLDEAEMEARDRWGRM